MKRLPSASIRGHLPHLRALAVGAFLSALIVLAPPPAGLALDNDRTRASLQGLPGVFPVVEDLRVEIEEDGLTRNEVRRHLEQRLTDAGIRLLTEAQWRETPGSPWLYLYAHVMRREYVNERVYVFNISIEVKQKALLTRTTDAEPLHVTTWSRSFLGKSAWLEDVREALDLCIQDFVEAYRSVNPGHSGP